MTSSSGPAREAVTIGAASVQETSFAGVGRPLAS